MEFNIDAALKSINFTSVDSSYSVSRLSPHVSIPSPKALEEVCVNGDFQLAEKILGERSPVPFGGALYLAVESKQLRIIELLLSRGAPLGVSHVKAATLNKDIGALDILINHGWDINTPLGWAVPPPLSLAIDDSNLVDWFFAHVQFADASITRKFFSSGGSIEHGQLLHYAVRRDLDDCIDIILYILSQGAPVNDVTYQHRSDSWALQQAFGLGTPLHDAARLGKLNAARVLLDHGADCTIKDSLGFTPVQRAEENQHAAVADYLRGSMTV